MMRFVALDGRFYQDGPFVGQFLTPPEVDKAVVAA